MIKFNKIQMEERLKSMMEFINSVEEEKKNQTLYTDDLYFF